MKKRWAKNLRTNTQGYLILRADFPAQKIRPTIFDSIHCDPRQEGNLDGWQSQLLACPLDLPHPEPERLANPGSESLSY